VIKAASQTVLAFANTDPTLGACLKTSSPFEPSLGFELTAFRGLVTWLGQDHLFHPFLTSIVLISRGVDTSISTGQVGWFLSKREQRSDRTKRARLSDHAKILNFAIALTYFKKG
jgi:hypothetical protein